MKFFYIIIASIIVLSILSISGCKRDQATKDTPPPTEKITSPYPTDSPTEKSIIFENTPHTESIQYYNFNNNLQSFTIEIGRNDPDIQSKKKYNFSIPKDISFETEGIDASSECLIFVYNEQTIFKLCGSDYIAYSFEELKKLKPNAYGITNVGNHQNVLELITPQAKPALDIFIKSLTIGDEKAFETL